MSNPEGSQRRFFSPQEKMRVLKRLRSKLLRKSEVLAELMDEHKQLRKELGES